MFKDIPSFFCPPFPSSGMYLYIVPVRLSTSNGFCKCLYIYSGKVMCLGTCVSLSDVFFILFYFHFSLFFCLFVSLVLFFIAFLLLLLFDFFNFHILFIFPVIFVEHLYIIFSFWFCIILIHVALRKNAKISPNFLVWKFCGNAQFPQSFWQFS